ncbi:MAG: ABC transporter permease, partial [Anaerolineales bacterium]
MHGVTAALAAVTLTFFSLRFASGDPLAGILAQGLATPEQAEALRRSLGLDLPIGEQYLRFLAGLPRGDFGRSLFTGRPVTEVVAEQLPHSLALGASAFAAGLLLGAALGIAAGWARSRWTARAAEGLAVLGTSLPVA